MNKTNNTDHNIISKETKNKKNKEVDEFIKNKLLDGMSQIFDIFLKLNLIHKGIHECEKGALQDPAGTAIDNIKNNVFIPSGSNASGSIYDLFFNNDENKKKKKKF